MGKVVNIIGMDISKRYFQLHGATAGGEPVLRKKLTRSKLLGFLAAQPVCRVVMESVRQRSPLGAADPGARPRGPPDSPSVRVT